MPTQFFFEKRKFIDMWAGPRPTHSEKPFSIRKNGLCHIFSFCFMSVKAFLMEIIDTLLHLTSKFGQKTCIPTSVVVFFSRFLQFQNDCNKKASSLYFRGNSWKDVNDIFIFYYFSSKRYLLHYKSRQNLHNFFGFHRESQLYLPVFRAWFPK